jgi:hypothetical protein
VPQPTAYRRTTVQPSSIFHSTVRTATKKVRPKRRIMDQAVGRRLLDAEARVWSRVSPCEICGGQSGTGIMFFSQDFSFPLSVSFQQCSILIHSPTTDAICFAPSTSDFSCQYHSAIGPYSFIHLPPTLHNVYLPALQFSPPSIIPSMINARSFTYNQRRIMFFSQYFGFALSVLFHQ